jgi:hypothetical protein
MAKKTIAQKFRDFLDESHESNKPMTRKEIKTTEAKKKKRAAKKSAKKTKKAKKKSKR